MTSTCTREPAASMTGMTHKHDWRLGTDKSMLITPSHRSFHTFLHWTSVEIQVRLTAAPSGLVRQVVAQASPGKSPPPRRSCSAGGERMSPRPRPPCISVPTRPQSCKFDFTTSARHALRRQPLRTVHIATQPSSPSPKCAARIAPPSVRALH